VITVLVTYLTFSPLGLAK